VSTAAARGDDAIAFYAADIGETRELAVTAAGIQSPDAEGALTKGRWLIQAYDFSTPNVVVWISSGPFVKGSPLTLTTGPGARRVPLSPRTLVAIETNVVKGASDRIGAITTAGTVTLWLTRISRGA
jgi:hypothetical protein